MGILTWIVIGLTVGFLASIFSKSSGIRKLTMVIVSLVGALIGWLNVAFLYQVPGTVNNINWISIVAALVGALLSVALFSLLKPQKARLYRKLNS